MHVRLSRVAGVTEQRDDLATLYTIPNFYAQRPRLHVGIECVFTVADVDADVIPADGHEIDFHCSPADNVLGNAVFRDGDDSVGDSTQLMPVSIVAGVLRRITSGTTRPSCGIDLQEVDREALSARDVSFERHHEPAMPRPV